MGEKAFALEFQAGQKVSCWVQAGEKALALESQMGEKALALESLMGEKALALEFQAAK